jgi:gas vesicle protein
MTDKEVKVAISSQLISFSLAMIALLGAIFVFILDKKEASSLFYLLILSTFLSFLISIIHAGKGMQSLTKPEEVKILSESTINEDVDELNNVQKNNKNDYKHISSFGYQAAFNFLGICLFIPTIFTVNDKKDEIVEQVKKINENLKNQTEYILKQNEVNNKLNDKIKELEKKIDLLENKIKIDTSKIK